MAGKGVAEHHTHSVHNLIQRIFGFLAVQYALGMSLTMFSDNGDLTKKPYYTQAALFIHILLGLFLFAGSVMIYLHCLRRDNEHFTRLALYGLVSIVVAGIGGMMSVFFRETLSDIGSYIMALGFLVSFANYGYLLFISRNTSRLAL